MALDQRLLFAWQIISFYTNALTAKLYNLHFHPLKVSRRRDPQLQVSEIFRFDKMKVNSFQILLIDDTFYLYHV